MWERGCKNVGRGKREMGKGDAKMWGRRERENVERREHKDMRKGDVKMWEEGTKKCEKGFENVKRRKSKRRKSKKHKKA